MEPSSIVSLLPAPVVALALYLLVRYKYPDGKYGLFYKSFLLGLAGVVAVFIVDALIIKLHLNQLHSLNRTLFYAFVLTGGVFELWIFMVLRLLVYPSKDITKPIDMMFYSLVIAAGFTTSYSVYALFYAPPYINVWLYALTIGPVFVSIAIMMGYFAGIAISRNYPFTDLVTGLFLAVIFQGIYRFCLLTSDFPLMYMAVAGMVLTGISLFIMTLRHPAELN